MATEQFMLSTIDNPYNPFTHYDEWIQYDESSGYYTNSFLSRVVMSSDELSEADQLVAIEQGIDEIVKENVLGIYCKVYPDQVVVARNILV